MFHADFCVAKVEFDKNQDEYILHFKGLKLNFSLKVWLNGAKNAFSSENYQNSFLLNDT